MKWLNVMFKIIDYCEDNGVTAEMINEAMDRKVLFTQNDMDLVSQFHSAFNVSHKETPCVPEASVCLLRLQLIQEELAELAAAFAGNDPVETLDALCDLKYVILGTFLACGMDGVERSAMRRVHDSNMSKLDDDGKPIIAANGRVMKSENYKRVKLEDLICT